MYSNTLFFYFISEDLSRKWKQGLSHKKKILKLYYKKKKIIKITRLDFTLMLNGSYDSWSSNELF